MNSSLRLLSPHFLNMSAVSPLFPLFASFIPPLLSFLLSSSELIQLNTIVQHTIKPLFISFSLSCILLKCLCTGHNKIHSLSFCLCRPPNHYCMADNAAAASATQRWDGGLSSHSATHTQGDNDILFRDWVCVCRWVVTAYLCSLWPWRLSLCPLSFALLYTEHRCVCVCLLPPTVMCFHLLSGFICFALTHTHTQTCHMPHLAQSCSKSH